MSYVSLYRKYRPTDFKNLAGHENVKNILKSELKNDSLPNSIIFVGQKGTGKTSLAKILAKIINCSNLDKEKIESCDKCNSCLMSLNNSHPDIIEMDAASNNGVEEIRNIKSNVSTMPTMGNKKVFIIDEVHMLTVNAFNAFLKTLEEPPKNVVFILATTEFQKIPATILSRCQIFNFNRINLEDLSKRLEDILQIEGFDFESEILEEIYYLSDGSLRDALNYLEQLIMISEKKIELKNVKKLFSITTKNEKLNLIKFILTGNTKNIIDFFEKSISKNINVEIFILQIIDILKELIEYKISNDHNIFKILNSEDIIEFDKNNLEDFFSIIDVMVNVYEKTVRTNISYQFLLVSILKYVSLSSKLISLQGNDLDNLKNSNLEIIKKTYDMKEAINTKKNFEVTKEEIINKPNLKQEENFIKNSNLDFSKQKKEMLDNYLRADFKNENFLVNENYEITNMKTISKISMSDLLEIKMENQKIINVLVGATSENRNSFSNSFSEMFINRNNLPSSFLIFNDMKVVAACENSVILKTDENIYSKVANNFLQYDFFRNKFLENLNSIQKNIFVVNKEEWQKIKEEYINLKKTNSFPEYNKSLNENNFYDSLIKHKSKIILEEDEYLKRAKELFGEGNIKVVN